MHIFSKIGITSVGALLLALTNPALSATKPQALEPPQKDAVIHFADLGGVQNWKAVGDDVLEIEGRNGQWYRAELWRDCFGLRTANEIAFVTEPGGDLTNFSSILVKREECHFKTFTKIEAPSN